MTDEPTDDPHAPTPLPDDWPTLDDGHPAASTRDDEPCGECTRLDRRCHHHPVPGQTPADELWNEARKDGLLGILNIPRPSDDTPHEDWSYAQRRRYIARLALRTEVGGLQNVPVARVGERFNVHHEQIRQDCQAIRDAVADNPFAGEAIRQEFSLGRLLDEADEVGEELAILGTRWNRAQDLGQAPKAPDRHEVSGPDGGPVKAEFVVEEPGPGTEGPPPEDRNGEEATDD